MIEKIMALPHFHFDVEWWKTDTGHAEDAVIIITKALQLLDKYPEFTYVLDQGFAIKAFLEKYPEEKQKIIELVRKGRVEIVGGTLAAPDENIPYGESLIRQFLYGKRFARELGQDVKVAWEIDEFGHPHQMPQILKKCGFEYFVFSRGIIPWDSMQPLSFLWEGPDGSKILSHWFAAHYCGMPVLYKDKNKNIKRWNKELKSRLVYEGKRHHLSILPVPFGTDFTIPSEDWLTFVKLWNEKEKVPIEFSLPGNYFKKIKQEKFKTIKGEFNPLFTGCYSSREKVKKYCRKIQNKILTCEKFSTIASFFGFEYPENDFSFCWENILKNDFHDTICGTGTDKVYQKTIKRYKEVEKILDKNINSSLEKICERIEYKNSKGVVVFNPLPWERKEIIKINKTQVEVNIPSLGYSVFYPEKNKKEGKLKASKYGLENEYFILELNKQGNIKSLYDKELKFEFLKTDNFSCGEILIEEDVGNLWTIHKTGKIYREEKFAEAEVVEKSNLQATVEVKIKHHKTEIIKRITVYSGKRRIDFEVDINFSGKDKIVKVIFPTNICGKSYFETPFYVAERGDGIWCAQNFVDISDEKVGFAVINSGCPGYEVEKGNMSLILFRSVSLFSPALLKFVMKNLPQVVQAFLESYSLFKKGLNNVEFPLYKYHGLTLRDWATEGGPDCFGSGELYSHFIASLKFLKQADAWERGMHTFRYAILPHAGNFKDAGLPRQGYEFNNPPIIFTPMSKKNNLSENKKMEESFSFLSIEEGDNLILNVLKKSHDDIILRIYETFGKETNFKLKFFKKIKDVKKISATEDKIYEDVEFEDNVIYSTVGKWEIATYRVTV